MNPKKNNSAYPSLATSASTSNNDLWKNSSPKFVQSSPRRESPSSSVNNSSNTSSYTTAFVRGRPTKAENVEFPELPINSNSSFSQQRIKKNGSESNAWGQGGSSASDNNKNENDSEDDSSYSESTKDGNKKKKQKKQKGKNVIFHLGPKNYQ